MGRMPIEIKKQEYSCIYPELLEKTPKKILILYTHIYHLLSVLGGLPCIPICITYQSIVGLPGLYSHIYHLSFLVGLLCIPIYITYQSKLGYPVYPYISPISPRSVTLYTHKYHLLSVLGKELMMAVPGLLHLFHIDTVRTRKLWNMKTTLSNR